MGNNSIVEHRGNYHFVALREEFLIICQECKYKKPDTSKSKNKASIHCKALILDILEHWTNTKRDKGASLAVYMTYKQWSEYMYGMFGRNVIIDSIDELLGEGLIARTPYKMYGKDTFQYYLNYRELNNRIKCLPEKAPDQVQPQTDYPFTNKPLESDTRLQVNATDLLVNATGLQVNEDAFISNHNVDTTQTQDIDSSEIERTNEPPIEQKETSILSDDQKIFLIDTYHQSKIGRIVPDAIDEIFKDRLIKLMQYASTLEKLDSLYEYVQKRLLETNLKDKTVYLGNLVSAKHLNGWLQEQERLQQNMDPYVLATMQSAGRLLASTPGSQYVDQEQMRDIDEGLIFGQLPEYWTEEHIKHERPIRQDSIRTKLNQWRQEHELITAGPLAGQPDYHADPWA